jgi:hypothetical protein
VVRNEGLRAAKDPRKVAAAQLLSTSEREEDTQPSRISKTTSPLHRLGERRRIRQSAAYTLGGVEVEAQKIACVLSCDAAILTLV